MTDSNFCCLCASDEGVFLDIFTATDRQLGNRSFLKELETCLSLKVKQDEALSTKICHRCAIELGQCTEFVEKYHRMYDATSDRKKSISRKSCCLCFSAAKNQYIFTLAKDYCSSINPLQKIYECFNRQITREDAERQSICLLCRYNLDVLFDLKRLASEVDLKLQKIAESRAILSNLPKTETFVVNRKTTITYQSKPELESISDSESESSTMARRSTRTKKVGTIKSSAGIKLRTCGQCHTSIEGGIDMYRLHSTGKTVCKMCWITMDPFNPTRGSKRKISNETEGNNTRLCTVFLKDVLGSASLKKDGPPQLHKEEQESEIYVISDDSSIDEVETSPRSKKKLRNQRANKSGTESDTNLKQGLKRGLKQDKVQKDNTVNKKLKSVKNVAIIVPSTPRRSTRYRSSDSDSVSSRSKRSDASNVENNTTKRVKSSPNVGDDGSEEKLSRIKPAKTYGKRKGVNTKTVESKSEDSASSDNAGMGQKPRKSNEQNRAASQLPDASCSSDFTSKNEKSTRKEIPTSTTPPKTDDDRSNASDHQTEEEKGSIRRSLCSESIEQNDNTDIGNAKETEPVSSSNDPPLEQESISVINDSNTEGTETVAPLELPVESINTIQKGDETDPEADSMTETNVNELDETVKLSNESVDKDTAEEEKVIEDLEKTIDNVVEKQDVDDKTNNGEDLPSSKTTADKDVGKARDSGEELESDTDIRIVDTGSSAEDSREQTEKCSIDTTEDVKNVSVEKETEEKPIETKEDLKSNGDESKETSNDKPDTDISSTIHLDDNPDVANESNGLSSQVVEENGKECETSEVSEKVEEDVRPPSSMTEVSQEVMDLATAEVQKRIESEETPIAETLENISEEINKTAPESPVVDEILANVDTIMSKETEPCELHLNSTENLLENHLDESNVDV